MEIIHTGISGIFWTIVYIEAIRLGARDKTYALPFCALALNLGWEIVYSIYRYQTDNPQWTVFFLWALLDAIIVCTFVRYGYSSFSNVLRKSQFYFMSFLAFPMGICIQWLILIEFESKGIDAQGYSAVLQNVVMSALFIPMVLSRQENGNRGQSLLLGWSKWIGTLPATIFYGIQTQNLFFFGIGVICTILDISYIIMLYKFKRIKNKVAEVMV